ncbi:ATP-binding response regulator [Fluviispira vulneris]|uniref:ATP-binding response regulator n=1 Tax=Fluviispira vulneris TaxID=2763012 RepID=UPI001646FBD8|nr:hybrid sensor histidine kinase/response regulator [Fluviispira vulneris]
MNRRYRNYNYLLSQVREAEIKGILTSVRMLAHDIRDPFSKLKVFLNFLEDNKKSDLNLNIPSIKKDLNSSIDKVNHMLNDFMSFGDASEKHGESFDFEYFLYNFLMNISKINAECNYKFTYTLNHKYLIYFNKIKFERVLNNLLVNSIEAMQGNGEIWIKTKDINQSNNKFMQIIFGNSNSYIDKNYISNIFDLSFTMGKETGNGIGLYSVKSIINSFGGDIKCYSDKQYGVEFIFTVPISEEKKLSTEKIQLPNCANEIYKYQQNKLSRNFSEKNNYRILEIINFINLNIKKMSVLIIEDNEIHLNSIHSLISSSMKNYENDIIFYSASNFHDALKIYEKENPQIVITDIDLKDKINDGFDLIKYIRKSNKLTYICVHTNRIFSKKRVFELGANLFKLKPMDYICLSDIFENFCKIYQDNKDLKKISSIIIVEDNKFYMNMWKNALKLHKLHCYNNPEELFNDIFQDKKLLKTIDCIILDYFYEGINKNIVQMNFISLLRRSGYKNPCFLSSLIKCSQEELLDFDGFLEKKPHSFEEIKALFPQKYKGISYEKNFN